MCSVFSIPLVLALLSLNFAPACVLESICVYRQNEGDFALASNLSSPACHCPLRSYGRLRHSVNSMYAHAVRRPITSTPGETMGRCTD